MTKTQFFNNLAKIKLFALLLSLLIFVTQTLQADEGISPTKKEVHVTKAEQEIIDLSKTKWQWMSEKNVEALSELFHEKAVFVHMGGTMQRQQELDVIKTGGIHYKKADIHEVSVNIIGSTAICLNKIALLAVVGGNEVTNNFVVTEVYVKEKNKWKLASLSFTKLLAP